MKPSLERLNPCHASLLNHLSQTHPLTFRLELVRIRRVKVEVLIACAAEYDAVNHGLRNRRLPADTDLGFTVFIRIVGFPCALGMKFTLGLHL